MSRHDSDRSPQDRLAEPGLIYLPGYTLEIGLSSVGPGWASLVRAPFDLLLEGGGRIIQVQEQHGELTILTRDSAVGPPQGLERSKLTDIAAQSRSVCEACGSKVAAQESDSLRDSAHGCCL
jgi:hypothetical protein